jgi:hypothetical protein
MGYFGAPVESQTGQLAGMPVTTTFNGYFAAIVAGASANYKLAEVKVGVRAGAVVPTSQQYTIGVFRQTVRVVGTGFSTVTGLNLDPRGAATAITGVDITTAATAGTTGPTIGANAIDKITLNTQSGWDVVWTPPIELICDQGTANGIAFVNIGNTLPTGHLIVLSPYWLE